METATHGGKKDRCALRHSAFLLSICVTPGTRIDVTLILRTRVFWPGIRLDLAGATLIDFNLIHGVMTDARFGGATFTGDARFGGAIFTGADFGGATFSRLTFERSRVLSPDAQHVWPTGWRLGPDGSDGYTVVRADDGLDTGLEPETLPAAGMAEGA